MIFTSAKLDKLVGKVAGIRGYLQKPEDLIAAELRMIKATVPRERATKDVEDLKAILEFNEVNLGKIRHLAGRDKKPTRFLTAFSKKNN